MVTDGSGWRPDDQPRPSPTEPNIEESVLDPAGQHTPAQEEALAEQAQADEEAIERAGQETTAREIEADQIPDAGAKGAPGAGDREEAAARADAEVEVERGLIEDDSLAVAPDAEDADDLDT